MIINDPYSTVSNGNAVVNMGREKKIISYIPPTHLNKRAPAARGGGEKKLSIAAYQLFTLGTEGAIQGQQQSHTHTRLTQNVTVGRLELYLYI